MKFLSSYIVLLYCWISHAKNLPSFVKRCKLNGPDTDECIARQTEQFLHHLIKGIPGIKIPKLDPLILPQLKIESDKFQATFSDIKVYGVPNLKVTSVHLDSSIPKIDLSMHFPLLEVWAKYAFMGNMLSFQLAGTGPISVNSTIDSISYLTGNFITRNEKKYSNFDQSSTNITFVSKPKFYIYNLFAGNLALTEEMNRLCAANFDVVSPEIVPLITNGVGALIASFVKNFFLDFTIEELFE